MIRKKGSLTYLSSPMLESEGGITHCFLTRKGGRSVHPFASLNLSAAEGDEKDNILYHKKLIGDTFGFSLSSLVILKQVHGKDVILIDMVKESNLLTLNLEGDAMITNRRGYVLGVLTADCLPILLFDPSMHVVGIVHAGWRGTVLRVVQETIFKMEKVFGVKRDMLRVAIGPSIGPCCYDVNEDVLNSMERELNGKVSLVGERNLNLVETNLRLLLKMGIREDFIESVGICTSCREDLLFSYRRDGRTGRQLSFIRLD